MTDLEKSFQERMVRFFEEPTRDKLREVIRDNLGELDNLDFKGEWPEKSKLAKHLLAFANSGRGCIVIGVTESNDSLESQGVDEPLDKADFYNRVESYIPDKLDFELVTFPYEESEFADLEGKTFQVVFIDDTPEHIPFVSLKSGKNIESPVIYTRTGTRSEPASYKELQDILNRKIETNYPTSSEMKLEEHLSQLEVLYDNIDRYIVHYKGGITKTINMAVKSMVGEVDKEENPNYPDEDYQEFIGRMIEKKKSRIESLLLG